MADVRDASLTRIIEDAGAVGQEPSTCRPSRAPRGRRCSCRRYRDSGELDRLTRSVRDLAELLERFARRNVALVSVAESLDTGSAAGRLVLNVMASVSQWEREAIGERTRDALRHKKALGQRVGTIPFGFGVASRTARTLVPLAAEKAGIGRHPAPLAARPFATCRAPLVRTRQGFATRRGSRWSLRSVHHLVAQVLEEPR